MIFNKTVSTQKKLKWKIRRMSIWRVIIPLQNLNFNICEWENDFFCGRRKPGPKKARGQTEVVCQTKTCEIHRVLISDYCRCPSASRKRFFNRNARINHRLFTRNPSSDIDFNNSCNNGAGKKRNNKPPAV